MDNKLKASKIELEETVSQLNSSQQSRFRVLFARQQQSFWLIPVTLSILGGYALLATTLLNPSYSWLVVLIPTLFVVFFFRSLLSGLVGDKKNRQANYGSIILPLVLISLFILCGMLAWGYTENNRQHQDYLTNYQQCQQNPAREVAPEYSWSYSWRSCDEILLEDRHQTAVRNHEREQNQLLRGLGISGLGLVIIYPLAIYYFRALINKRNLLAAQAIIAQIKGDQPDPADQSK